MRIVKHSGLAMLGICLFALPGCAVNAGKDIERGTEKLIGYFDAKSEMARTLENYFVGKVGDPNYTLVAINGPSYPVGALVSAANPLDIESRACQIDSASLPPREPWGGQPVWNSSSKLDMGLAIPAPMRGLLHGAESSLSTGLKIEKTSVFGLSDISQVLLARADVRSVLARPGCASALEAAEGSKAMFVRGIVYGQETLASARRFNAGLGLRVMSGETGQFTLSYDNTGAYELRENQPMPKFAILATVSLPPVNKSTLPSGGELRFGKPSPAVVQQVEAIGR